LRLTFRYFNGSEYSSIVSPSYNVEVTQGATLFPGRSTVGRLAVNQAMLVRFQPGEPQVRYSKVA
jgi:hypothetical protein